MKSPTRASKAKIAAPAVAAATTPPKLAIAGMPYRLPEKKAPAPEKTSAEKAASKKQ